MTFMFGDWPTDLIRPIYSPSCPSVSEQLKDPLLSDLCPSRPLESDQRIEASRQLLGHLLGPW